MFNWCFPGQVATLEGIAAWPRLRSSIVTPNRQWVRWSRAHHWGCSARSVQFCRSTTDGGPGGSGVRAGGQFCLTVPAVFRAAILHGAPVRAAPKGLGTLLDMGSGSPARAAHPHATLGREAGPRGRGQVEADSRLRLSLTQPAGLPGRSQPHRWPAQTSQVPWHSGGNLCATVKHSGQHVEAGQHDQEEDTGKRGGPQDLPPASCRGRCLLGRGGRRGLMNEQPNGGSEHRTNGNRQPSRTEYRIENALQEAGWSGHWRGT